MKMTRYSIEPRTRKCVKGFGFFCHLREIYLTNMEKKLLDTAKNTPLDAAKTASKKVIHKTVEATGEVIGNKIAEAKTYNQ